MTSQPQERLLDEILALVLKQQAYLRGEATDSKSFLVLPRGDTANRAAFGRAIRVGASRFRPRSFDEGALDGGGYRMRLGRDADPGPARHLPLLFNDTIFLATADGMRRTEQIVLAVRPTETSNVRWRFERLTRAPQVPPTEPGPELL